MSDTQSGIEAERAVAPDESETDDTATDEYVEAEADMLEDEVEEEEPRADDSAALTVGDAASEYFSARAKKMDQATRVAVTRFVSWCGPTRELTGLTPHEMTQFQESVGENAADLGDRLLPVKDFFAFARRKGWTATNLGVHLRVKRAAPKRSSDRPVAEKAEDVIFEMTEEGLRAAREEHARLLDERGRATAAVAAAMEDKDFRENAPLDAARDHQAHVEARIRDLEYQIAHVVVVKSGGRDSGQAQVGSTVAAVNLESGRSVRYTLVGQNEVDAAAGRISIASPVGQGFVGRAPGDVVEVAAPSGTIRFRIETVEG